METCNKYSRAFYFRKYLSTESVYLYKYFVLRQIPSQKWSTSTVAAAYYDNAIFMLPGVDMIAELTYTRIRPPTLFHAKEPLIKSWSRNRSVDNNFNASPVICLNGNGPRKTHRPQVREQWISRRPCDSLDLY